MTVLELAVGIAVLLAVFWVGRLLIHRFWPYRTTSIEAAGVLEHAQVQSSGPVRVTISALGRTEAHRVFGVPLAIRGIQPVWIEVENGEDVPLFYLRAGTDASWYSPFETSWLARYRAARPANRKLQDRCYDLSFKNPIPPGQTRCGCIFTRVDEGTKAVDLDLVGIGKVVHSFTFSLDVPGFRVDSQGIDFEKLYAPQDVVDLESEDDLREALEALPRCTSNKAGDRQGDPLNVVLIGTHADGRAAFARRGWHPTEQTYAAAVWRTIRSFIFRARYRYSPVSPLYVFGRRQDISAQKARESITLRNHARFWLTHLRFRGDPVWIGQISRDIGVRFVLGLPPTTHKIDPDVDEARGGLVQDLGYSQALARFGYVKGVGEAPRDAQRVNLTGDPYFTDGLRAVLFFDKRPLTLEKVEFIDQWELPEPHR
ncbi:MAG: LssY C-terminal domain-containing protein [Phycisphaerales bacterium]